MTQSFPERPRVLITNDDGIAAPGIRALAAAAAERGLDVVVAAPATEASGSSAALTAVERDGRIVVERRPLPGLPDLPVYAVAASPAFITLLALRGAFGPAPDVVLSGINRGANAGQAVLHSGTVGAALTAAADDRRAIAVSLDVLTAAAASAASGGAALAAIDQVDDQARHWSTAAALALDLFPTLAGAPAGMVLNLNVPDLPADRLGGLRTSRLARFGQVQVAVVHAGADYVQTAVQQSSATLEPGTDVADLAEGWATVTPLRAIGDTQDFAVELPALRGA